MQVSDNFPNGQRPTPRAGGEPPGRPSAPEPGIRPRPPMSPATRAWFLGLVAWTIVLSFYRLDDGAGFEPVDCWVAQPSREMHEHIQAEGWRGLITPYLSGELFLHKSPGPYWAVNLSAYLRGEGVDETTVRTPGAVAAVVLVMTIFWLTRRIAGDRAAIFAGYAAAGSVFILYWSHRGCADLSVTALLTLSLACLWIGSESEPPGWRRIALWMLGYFFAGLAMIDKMPMPLVCVGIPALLYVLLRNRWRILASPWHILGLVLFLLPWLPWALTIAFKIPAALPKWRVEYWDRITGDLPNVTGQFTWYFYLMYVGVALALAFPFSLSIPRAIGRAFRRAPGVDRNGQWFVLIWFLGLFVFFTLSTGKETRYFLPAMPPLLVMLGIELAAFFDPQRPARPQWDRRGFWAVAVLVPLGFIGCGFALRNWYNKNVTAGMFPWSDVLWPAVGGAVILAGGMICAAWLYRRRKEHASFAALVGVMWLAWLWLWPTLMPRIGSQAAYKDFAAQLAALDGRYRGDLRQVAHHDPRILWYSDVRYPRLIDQLEMLEQEGGERDLAWERQQYGEKMVEILAQDESTLMVISYDQYCEFQTQAPLALAAQGRTMPMSHIWLQSRLGRVDRHYLLFSSQPPPWPEPDLQVRGREAGRIAEAQEKAARLLQDRQAATTQSQPAPVE